jgi:predicted pyridoxine 5'-phosphate oxidase superfamily flavin-nucleotide-binding protein
MSSRFGAIAFTPAVKRLQERDGSRASYARGESEAAPADPLGAAEAAFIAGRDSFYMATVSETGWPYLQHRGGPAGFLKVLDAQTLAFADFRGNRQHVSEGNLEGNDRVALFLMDYPNRRRLKVLGRVRVVDAADDPALLGALTEPGYPAKAERAMVIRVEAFDWNCPQHITPRFSEAELAPVVASLQARIHDLEEQLKFASSV